MDAQGLKLLKFNVRSIRYDKAVKESTLGDTAFKLLLAEMGIDTSKLEFDTLLYFPVTKAMELQASKLHKDYNKDFFYLGSSETIGLTEEEVVSKLREHGQTPRIII